MRRSSSLLSRLALALLALMGFVAPLSAMEVDRVVQTTGAKPAMVEVAEATIELAVANEPPRASAAPGGEVEHSARRYLLHCAWLI